MSEVALVGAALCQTSPVWHVLGRLLFGWVRAVLGASLFMRLPMNNQFTNEIKDYLRGAARHKGVGVLLNFEAADWVRLAAELQQQRRDAKAKSVLSLLSDEALAAVQDGSVSMPELIGSI